MLRPRDLVNLKWEHLHLQDDSKGLAWVQGAHPDKTLTGSGREWTGADGPTLLRVAGLVPPLQRTGQKGGSGGEHLEYRSSAADTKGGKGVYRLDVGGKGIRLASSC